MGMAQILKRRKRNAQKQLQHSEMQDDKCNNKYKCMKTKADADCLEKKEEGGARWGNLIQSNKCWLEVEDK